MDTRLEMDTRPINLYTPLWRCTAASAATAMTVKELIRHLKLYPDDYRVILRADELDFPDRPLGHREIGTVCGHIDLQAVVLGSGEPVKP